MNGKRRLLIGKVIEQLENLKMEIETLQEIEQEAFDNLPEGLQQSDKGTAMEEASSALEAALSSLEETTNSLEEASV